VGKERRRKMTIDNQLNQLELSWKSYEWLIKDRLIKIDEITRSMIKEMHLCGVPSSMIAEHLPRRFEDLKRRVVDENDRRFHGNQHSRMVNE